MNGATSQPIITGIIAAGCVGAALVGGIFAAFSALVMRALGTLTPEDGMSAMQDINRSAIGPVVLGGLLGTAGVCGVLLVVTPLTASGADGPPVLFGAVVYLLGALGPTMAYHVPRNEALARVATSDPAAPALWDRYRAGWTAANHVRAVASLLAAVGLALGLVLR